MLNKRLMACAEYVNGGGVVCDIGTDHAHLPIYLVENGICKTAYACDVASGPLESASKSVESAGLGGSIRLIRSDGLDSVPEDGISDIVIAGMGGELIVDILSRAEWIKDGVNLVLQPNTKEVLLIKWLYGNGFRVVSKKACIDGRFTYIILKAAYTDEDCQISEFDCIAAGLDQKDEASAAYIKKHADRFLTAAKGMSESKDKEISAEAERLTALANSLLEYINT